jgi:hypothetical protein
MKIWLICILIALFAIVAGGADAPLPKPEPYDLEIKFEPPRLGFTMLTTIYIGQPFELIAVNGPDRYGVSGTLQPPKEGKHPISLTIFRGNEEWKSNYWRELELEKAYIPCSGAIVHCTFITLRKHESPIIPKKTAIQ